MPFRFNACLPQCLRPETSAEDDLSDDAESSVRRSHSSGGHQEGDLALHRTERGNGFGDGRGLRASQPGVRASDVDAPARAVEYPAAPVSLTDWHAELAFLALTMKDFPRTRPLLAVLAEGRLLQAEDLRGGQADAHQRMRLGHWRAHVQELKRQWEAMPTVSQRKADHLAHLLNLQGDSQLRLLLRDQWLHASEQVKSARNAFGKGQHRCAAEADRQAAGHLEVAHYLLTYWERATPQQRALLEARIDRCRSVRCYAEARAFLAGAQLPGWQDRLRTLSGQASRVLPGGPGPDHAAAAEERCSALPCEHRDDAVEELRRLQTAADGLPRAHALQAAVKRSCRAMEVAIAAGPGRLTGLQRAWIDLQGARVARDFEAAEWVADAGRRVEMMKAVVPQLPASQHYRLALAQQQHERMKSAYGREDYDRVQQLQDTHRALCRATGTLAQQSDGDLTLWEHLGERRAPLVQQLKRWTDEPVRPGWELLLADRVTTLIGELDHITDPRICEDGLIELDLLGHWLSHVDSPRLVGRRLDEPPPLPLHPPPDSVTPPLSSLPPAQGIAP